ITTRFPARSGNTSSRPAELIWNLSFLGTNKPSRSDAIGPRPNARATSWTGGNDSSKAGDEIDGKCTGFLVSRPLSLGDWSAGFRQTSKAPAPKILGAIWAEGDPLGIRL